MQDRDRGDPDADALWRLQNSKSLPVDWKPRSSEGGGLAGIHASRMAPFNAQATVLRLSRRALDLAFLPPTVHGRVSDIRRAYIIHRLPARAARPGAAAFSGASVAHNRSKHIHVADVDAFDAEATSRPGPSSRASRRARPTQLARPARRACG